MWLTFSWGVTEFENLDSAVYKVILRYDPGIPSVMPVAGGCLTMKKECDAWLFSQDAVAVFVDFSYF